MMRIVRDSCFVLAAIAAFYGYFKLFNSINMKKKNKIFSLEIHAVAQEFSIHFRCDKSSFLSFVDKNIRLCTRLKGIKCDERIRNAYSDGDYVLFVYLSALQYANQYRSDNFERIAIQEYCEDRMKFHNMDPGIPGGGWSKSVSKSDDYSETAVVAKAVLCLLVTIGAFIPIIQKLFPNW